MNKNVTEIICIVDKSKNMSSHRNTVMAKFNSYIKAKAASGKEYKVSVYFFNNLIDCVAREVIITDVPYLTRKQYTPQGPSMLNDAIGNIMDSVAQRIIKTSVENRPDNVECVIFTVGKDDISRNFTVDQVRSLISYRRDYFGWDVVFVDTKKTARMTTEK